MQRARFGFLVSFVLALACGDDGGTDDGADDTSGSSGGSADDAPTSMTMTSMTAADDDGSSTDPTVTTLDGSSTDGSSGPSDDSGSSSVGDSSTGSPACEGMTFFATSVGSGEMGGNLGGLEGADATCQALAEAVGQGGCTWHAYLSTSEEDARDRIGTGPWQNANGDMVASDVESLHDDGLPNGDPEQLVLDENGAEVPGNEHDILTGSNEDGTLLDGSTCADWTSSSGDDVARVGHSDIPDNPMFSPSWNSAHDTPGCAPDDLDQVGGAGRLYCFAI